MSRWIRLRDRRGRDARVRISSARRPQRPPLRATDGRKAESTRLVKAPLPKSYDALRARCSDDTELAELLVEGDPEVDFEAAGRETGPTDRVSLDGDGRVLYATGEIEVRRIEVKGRTRGQRIRLTVNEWYKAQELAQHYWLCVVWDPLGDDPQFVSVQNPSERLDHATREIVGIRLFEVPAQAIAAAGAQP